MPNSLMSNFALIPSVLLDDHMLLRMRELCTIVNLLANPGCGLNRGRVSAWWTLVPSLQCSVRSLA